MTRKSENPEMVESSRGTQLALIGGGTESTVPPVARPLPVITTGQLEFVARCPGCGRHHRHVSLGVKHAPCGATYDLQSKRGRAA
ncbi:hypothetical protein [Actinacidiphila sp. ITFR-21]|uniref:hypothetical protein n=1 Tax=Actinacidiphila sp. ITFR-21 TaxID=3075199 RepID=UPI002889D7E8|nr:hypothetical protein [Streptomyces sp. ITFR-21]WNI15220.1 hypothetical protein RLT57_06505 [Streptomyces sp. ITFR-21]